MQNIEQARQRQEAALIAAREKYLEEKRLVILFLKMILFKKYFKISLKKEERDAKEREEEWERHKQGLGYKSKLKRNDENPLESLGLGGVNKTLKKDDKTKLRPNGRFQFKFFNYYFVFLINPWIDLIKTELMI